MLGLEQAEATVTRRTKVQKGADRTQRVNNYAEWHVRLSEWGGQIVQKKKKRKNLVAKNFRILRTHIRLDDIFCLRLPEWSFKKIHLNTQGIHY